MKRTMRAWLSLTLAGCLLCTSLCACGGEKKKNILLHTFSTFGDEKDLAAYSAVIAGYTKQRRHVVVNDTTTTRANSYKMALSIASTYRGADAPDVVYFAAQSDMDELADYFMTVDDIRKDYPAFASRVSEAALDSTAASDGGRYCIPVRGEWQGIVVNAAMFRKSGLRIPETWDDIERAARHFSKNPVSMFANTLDDSGALVEYMVRSLGGLDSVRTAVDGKPDENWAKVMRAITELDELNAFPKMPAESFDSLVSPSDLKHTATETTASPIDLYNHEKAAILLMDNTMAGQVNADLDSRYIALPRVGTFSSVEITTTRFVYPTDVQYGAVYPRMTANTLPPTTAETNTTTAAAKKTASTTTRTTSRRITSTTTHRTTADGTVSPSDKEDKKRDSGLYVSFAEGFYITKKAYYDSDKREAALDFVESFLEEQNCIRLCADYQAPSLVSLSKDTDSKLNRQSGLYHAVVKAVQNSDRFVTSARTQETSYFWNRCSVAVSCLSKGILKQEEALRLIADPQLTVKDVCSYKQKKTAAQTRRTKATVRSKP